jgi:hypothetical protein
MRCIEAMGEWSQLHSLSETYWDKVSSNMKYLPCRVDRTSRPNGLYRERKKEEENILRSTDKQGSIFGRKIIPLPPPPSENYIYLPLATGCFLKLIATFLPLVFAIL